MNIQSAKYFTTFVGGMALGSLTMLGIKSCENLKATNKVRQEVRQSGISSNDFKKLDNSIGIFKQEHPILKWQEALDSMKFKGIAEKAYLEGANMVRDSIKTASKTIVK